MIVQYWQSRSSQCKAKPWSISGANFWHDTKCHIAWACKTAHKTLFFLHFDLLLRLLAILKSKNYQIWMLIRFNLLGFSSWAHMRNQFQMNGDTVFRELRSIWVIGIIVVFSRIFVKKIWQDQSHFLVKKLFNLISIYYMWGNITWWPITNKVKQ